MRRVVGEDAGTAGAFEGGEGFEDKGVAVSGACRCGSFDHRIFAGYLVGKDRNVEAILHPADDVEIGQARLYHHAVRTFGDVHRDFAQGLIAVGRIHLVAFLVALQQSA